MEEDQMHELHGHDGEVIASFHYPADYMGLKTRFDADGNVLNISFYTEGDFRAATRNRQQRINLITCIFAMEPLVALGLYMLLRPTGKSDA